MPVQPHLTGPAMRSSHACLPLHALRSSHASSSWHALPLTYPSVPCRIPVGRPVGERGGATSDVPSPRAATFCVRGGSLRSVRATATRRPQSAGRVGGRFGLLPRGYGNAVAAPGKACCWLAGSFSSICSGGDGSSSTSKLVQAAPSLGRFRNARASHPEHWDARGCIGPVP